MSALMSPGPGPLETGSYGEGTSVTLIELETNLREDFTITEKAPTKHLHTCNYLHSLKIAPKHQKNWDADTKIITDGRL